MRVGLLEIREADQKYEVNSMTRNNRDREELRAASEMLAYEVDMFLYTFAVLTRNLDKLLANMVLESYLVHARNLIDFFYPGTPYEDDIVANDYFDPPEAWTRSLDGAPQFLRTAKNRINKRLSHLAYKRLSITKNHQVGKIFDELRGALNAFLETVSHDLLSERLHRHEETWQKAQTYAGAWPPRRQR